MSELIARCKVNSMLQWAFGCRWILLQDAQFARAEKGFDIIRAERCGTVNVVFGLGYIPLCKIKLAHGAIHVRITGGKSIRCL